MTILASMLSALGGVAVGAGGIGFLASRLAKRFRIDAQVQRALTMADTEDEALDVASRAVGQAAPRCPGELLVANEAETEVHLAAISPAGAPGCPVATPGSCRAMREGRTLRFDDPEALDVCPHLRSRSGGARFAACIPLPAARGVSGVLHVTSEGKPINAESVARLELLASQVGGRLRMLHVLSVFQTQAETDALTGLLNRRAFEHRANAMLRSNRPFLLAVADLDWFKKLNDTHGHAAGDHALQVFARAARTFANEHGGFAARLGGEEFILVLPLERLGPALAEPFASFRGTLQTVTASACAPFTASIGAAIAPVNGTALSELLGAADRALYQAKSLGRDCFVLYGATRTSQRPVTPTGARVDAAAPLPS